MIKLHELKKHPKSTKPRKVVGRGIGSGHGTFSTRGNKGQTKRSGHSKLPIGFEGGRQPLIRQVPKSRGFTSLYDKAIAISVSELNKFNDGDVVTAKTLIEKGILRFFKGNNIPQVKILKGQLSKKLEVRVPVSKSAKESIEKAGGVVK